MVQLRLKDESARVLVEVARALREALPGVPLLVNDRADVALAAGADGVHVGQADDQVRAVREHVGPEMLIGLSTHSREQLESGLETDADYVCVGPVYATPTKPDYPAVGLDLVRHAAATVERLPWFAIGGIDGANVREVAAAGAPGVVVVRAIRTAQDPRVAAAGLRAAVEGASARVE